jgi:hypothetical protein
MTDICDNMLTSDHISDMKLIRNLFKNHHNYMQDSQEIVHSEILFVLGQNNKMVYVGTLKIRYPRVQVPGQDRR